MLSVEQIKEGLKRDGFTFTVQSVRTDKHYTFKVRKAKYAMMIDVLSGHDNLKHYTMIGFVMDNTTTFKYCEKSKFQKTAGSVKAIEYVFDTVFNKPNNMVQLNVFENSYCCVCGSRLTHPISVHNHIGLQCAYEQVGLMVARGLLAA